MTIEHIRRTKDKITGYIRLKDGSRTHFQVDKEYGWEQWGNYTNKLCETVPLMERLEQDLWNL